MKNTDLVFKLIEIGISEKEAKEEVRKYGFKERYESNFPREPEKVWSFFHIY